MLVSVRIQCIAVLAIIFTGPGGTSVKVSQLPDRTTSITGTNVSFHCSLPLFQRGPRVNVNWWKKGDDNYLRSRQNDRMITGFKTKFSGFLQIINVTVQDSGVYYCTVTHEGKTAGNGTGSHLEVWVPPTPLKINSQPTEKDSSARLTVLCATAHFSLENISFTWYKDGIKTAAGINTIIKPNANGLYEASSRLQETQPAHTPTVYTCLVSHSTLQIPAIATHVVTSPNTALLLGLVGGNWSTRRKPTQTQGEHAEQTVT
ncbi:tyrosine-protein phosphatase non-receptor type substrate 1-like isoform X3 [Scyliorhinus canicula]|uniref:tyrosine-protein phosphatase non-receptor type substrate 1-like isoform X3 n=1 Tax=Scyliorhinus canicula TaxID=7830 RepID=UPI0018F53B4A|nr:tyrosine-protein phosphatase non-receptor type substrate 1-like isoform X3 [Scyliorhinus canicula]